MANNNYTPFGSEWKKEMYKLPKKDIIEMLRNALIHNQKLQKNRMTLEMTLPEIKDHKKLSHTIGEILARAAESSEIKD